MEYEYKTRGVCSRKINFSVEDGKVCKVAFDGGCNGNGKGVAAVSRAEWEAARQGKATVRDLIRQDVDEAIRRMEGIKCGMKNTSCPDQLAQALRQTKNA